MAQRAKKRADGGGVTLDVSGRVPAAVVAGAARPRKAAKNGKGNGRIDLRGTVRAQAVSVAEADVTDELAKGGPAFGSFLQAVGLAVAESQKKLDETLVTTAKALSETQIDVIAVFEQQLKDADGQMDKGIVQIQKLPLVNYLMPTAYNFSRVFLQADMKVSEFNGANGMNIQGSSSNFSASAKASYGLFSGFSASGGVSYGQAGFSRSSETSVSTDTAAGSLHMEATLEPRKDIELPRPFVLQRGPKVQLRIDANEDIMGAEPAGGGPAPKVGRKVTLKAKLLKTDGTAHGGQSLVVTVSEAQFNRDAVAATDDKGETTIVVRNEWGTGATTEPPRKQAIVSASFGLATQTIGISL